MGGFPAFRVSDSASNSPSDKPSTEPESRTRHSPPSLFYFRSVSPRAGEATSMSLAFSMLKLKEEKEAVKHKRIRNIKYFLALEPAVAVRLRLVAMRPARGPGTPPPRRRDSARGEWLPPPGFRPVAVFGATARPPVFGPRSPARFAVSRA